MAVAEIGEIGVRDPESICEEYVPGSSDEDADCQTDGHYLCAGCRKKRKTYKFSELCKADQDRLIDKHRDINTDYDWWDGVYDDWIEKLEGLGFTEPKIWFSGFSSQGDGACFDCSSMDIDKFLESNKVQMICIFFPHMEIVKMLSEGIHMSTEIISHHYEHEHTRRMAFSYDYCVDLPALEDYIEEKCGTGTVNAFEEFVESTRLKLCKELYRILEKQYDYLTSDEAIKETLQDQDWEYDENGDRID